MVKLHRKYHKQLDYVYYASRPSYFSKLFDCDTRRTIFMFHPKFNGIQLFDMVALHGIKVPQWGTFKTLWTSQQYWHTTTFTTLFTTILYRYTIIFFIRLTNFALLKHYYNVLTVQNEMKLFTIIPSKYPTITLFPLQCPTHVR